MADKLSIKIIYLLGLGHSGTTLLGRILNAHSKAVATGGTKNIPLFVRGEKSCTCGAQSPQQCAHWTGVEKALATRGLSLCELEFGYDNQNNLNKDHLKAYFESVLESAGAEAIVDTSRRRGYFSKLEEVPGVELIPVHIFKDPRAQASSNKRKGMSVARSLWNYNLRGHRVRGMSTSGKPVLHLAYEDLCRDPEGEVARIMHYAGLEFEQDQVSAFGEKETHILGGNRQRTDKSSNIRLDETWRKRLTPLQQRLVSTFGGPAYRKNLAAVRQSPDRSQAD